MKLFVVTLAVCLGVAIAECPNSCSGHGDCDTNDRCTCQLEGVIINPDGNMDYETNELLDKEAAWTGADCSLMTCPRGVSWTDIAMDDDGSENYCKHESGRECSDMGLCDRANGQCECFPGYTGAACQRTECPNDCSGHGICQSNIKFAQDATILMQPALFEADGLNADFPYLVSYDNAWDSGLHFGCKCDIGYRGPDCSLVECPSNDDPLDDFCDSSSGLGYVEFVGTEYYYSATEGTLDPQESPLPNKLLLFVQDYYSESTGDQHDCSLTEDGSYLDSAGSDVELTGGDDVQCVSGSYCGGSSMGQPCSGRGLCNYADGTCECHDGYAGNACQTVEELA